jgi:hypothetical protein
MDLAKIKRAYRMDRWGAADVTQEANDINQLHMMLAEAQEQRHTIEYPQPIGTVLADADPGSEANLTEPIRQGRRC